MFINISIFIKTIILIYIFWLKLLITIILELNIFYEAKEIKFTIYADIDKI